MTLVYGIAIAVGAIGLLVMVAAAPNPDREATSPRVRNTVSAVLGFGLAGMSASFAGWHQGLAVLAAVAGAGGLVWIAIRYAVGAEE